MYPLKRFDYFNPADYTTLKLRRHSSVSLFWCILLQAELLFCRDDEPRENFFRRQKKSVDTQLEYKFLTVYTPCRAFHHVFLAGKTQRITLVFNSSGFVMNVLVPRKVAIYLARKTLLYCRTWRSRPARPSLLWLSAIHHLAELTLKCILIKIDESASNTSLREKSSSRTLDTPARRSCCKIQIWFE